MEANKIMEADLDDIIFEKRNKAYGAYFLRRNYFRNISMGGFIAIFFISFGMSTPTILNHIKGKVEVVKETKSKNVVTKLKAPPPMDQKKPPPPPPKVKVDPPKEIKFKKPDIKKDDTKLNKDDQPDMSKLKNLPVGKNDKTDGKMKYDANIPLQKKIIDDAPKVFKSVEIMPQFPGGDAKLFEFLQANLQYPSMARELGKQGTVIINFVVGPDGKPHDFIVKKPLGSGCDEEALRVCNLLPNFTPGLQNGKPVSVYFNLPINFKLNSGQ